MSRSSDLSKNSSSTTVSSTGSTQPNNVFHIWYAELCRRRKICPLTWSKSCNSNKRTILEFSADRLKLEDWIPLIEALKSDTSLHILSIRSRMGCAPFLDNIDTADKVRLMKQKFGLLRTDYMMKNLARSLGQMFKNNKVLTTVQLEGIPLLNDHLHLILDGLKFNYSIKNLSFKNSQIGEHGCLWLCKAIESLPTVRILNLSGCSLTPECGSYIAHLIRSHQLSRLDTSWHTSLRYNEPDAETMLGLRRITLNNNDLSDIGLEYILNELLDDVWIKALDMQKCGISEGMTPKIFELLKLSTTLQVIDFRNNDLSPSTLTKFSEIMKEKQALAKSKNIEAFDLIETKSSISQSTIRTMSSSATNKTYVLKKAPSKEPIKKVQTNQQPTSQPSKIVNLYTRNKPNGEESKQKDPPPIQVPKLKQLTRTYSVIVNKTNTKTEYTHLRKHSSSVIIKTTACHHLRKVDINKIPEETVTKNNHRNLKKKKSSAINSRKTTRKDEQRKRKINIQPFPQHSTIKTTNEYDDDSDGCLTDQETLRSLLEDSKSKDDDTDSISMQEGSFSSTSSVTSLIDYMKALKVGKLDRTSDDRG